MKRPKLLTVAALAVLFGGVALISAQKIASNSKLEGGSSQLKEKKVLYFNPEVYPNIEEIKEPTNTAFFSAVSDKISSLKNNKLLRTQTPVEFDNIDAKTIKEYCQNNDADFAVVPKVKYFKVGLGKYVFSNQVVVSMKLYDSEGVFITETNYDTYRKNMRLLGSSENSVKIGTSGAIRDLLKILRKKNVSEEEGFQ